MERLHDATLFRGEEVAFLHGRHTALGLLVARGRSQRGESWGTK